MFLRSMILILLMLSQPTCLLLAQMAELPSGAVSVDSSEVTPVLRSALLQALPQPLNEKTILWDHQKEVVVGLKWSGLKAIPQKSLRNDGHWQKLRFEAIDPASTLLVQVEDFANPEPQRTTFAMTVALDVRAFHEQQLWKSGVRLYAGETRARCRVVLKLNCELTTRTERASGSVLPSILFRLRVTQAHLSYRDLVCEKIIGLHGEPAKLAGEAVHRLLRQTRPQYERDLLARSQEALARAADTKEIRLELEQLLKIAKP